MSGPWEKYQAAAADAAPAGPWAKYQAQPDAAAAQAPASAPIDDIPRMLPRQRATALANLPQGAMQPGDLLAGLVRGAGSIGATLLTPYDLLAGNTQSIGNPERRAAMDQALLQLGADPESFAYKAGKVGGELAGTAGVGPALAPAARAVGASPALVSAINTAGMRTGAAPAGFAAKAADLGTRAAGGAINGGASAALADPSQAAGGAAVGAALPPVVKAAGAVATATGKTLRLSGAELTNMLKSEPTRAAQDLIRALDLTPEQIPAVVAKLRGAETLVDGAAPTVGQALSMPQASILERVVAAGPGGEKLRQALQAQAEARMAALHGVAPVDPNGYQQARADTGEAIGRYARPEEKRISDQITEMYKTIDPAGESRITLPVDQLQRVKGQYLGPGTVGSGKDAAAVIGEANRIGTMEVPAIHAGTAGPAQENLLAFVKRNGGISEQSVAARELSGEVRDLKQSGLGRVVYKNGGRNLSEITERAYEAGFIPDEDPALLLEMLRNNGRNTYGSSANLDRQFSAMRDAAMGDAPAAERIARPVPYQDMQNLRSSMGELATAADAKGNKREAAALRGMVAELDKKLNTIADGGGSFDDFFPQEMSDKWRAANASHSAKMDRFHTGPQASLFRNGADGQPVVQGGEVAAKFWGNRPGLAEDVQSFRRLIDDNPAMLGQFRSMITTEGADKAAQGGVLGAKFVDWVRNMKPGLRAAFEPAQLASLERIAADVERAGSAAKLGMGPGSNTYQNAATALDAGLLGSPMVKSIAQRTPILRAVAEPLRAAAAENASKAKALRLSDLLSNAGGAADELQRQAPSAAAAKFRHLMDMGGVTLGTPIPQLGGLTLSEFLRLGGYKAAPVAAAQ